MVWLSDGVDLGKGAEFVAGLSRVIGGHPLTVVDGGLPIAHALAAADNAAGALTRQGAARADRRRRRRHGDTRSISRGCRSARRRSRSAPARARPTRRSTCRSRSATTWRGWRSPASARPARCSCSTSAGAGAPSASISGSAADRSQPLLGASYYLGARAQSVRRRAACRGRRAGRTRSTVSSTSICRC